MSSTNERISLERARKDAKKLLRALKAGDPAARDRARPYFDETPTKLSEAQLVVARELGSPSWRALVKVAEMDFDDDIHQAARRGDLTRLDELLGLGRPSSHALVPLLLQPTDLDDAAFDAVVGRLLAAGCDPNAGVMHRGRKLDLLWGAAEHGHESAIPLLIEAGAAPIKADLED